MDILTDFIDDQELWLGKHLHGMGQPVLFEGRAETTRHFQGGKEEEAVSEFRGNPVITQLESWKPIAEAIEEQLAKIEAELRAAAPGKLIFGEGELTHELLARELIDPRRFRKQPPGGQLLWALPE